MAGPWLAVRLRWVIVPTYLALASIAIIGVGSRLGLEIFPKVDAGRFQLRIKAPTGTRIEETEKVAIAALGVIGEEVGPRRIDISLGYVGADPVELPDQRHLPVDGRTGGSAAPGRAQTESSDRRSRA